MFSFLGYVPDTLGVVGVEVLPAEVLQEPKSHDEHPIFLLFLLSSRSVSLDDHLILRIFLRLFMGTVKFELIVPLNSSIPAGWKTVWNIIS